MSSSPKVNPYLRRIPEVSLSWDDAITNVEYFWNRPVCKNRNCRLHYEELERDYNPGKRQYENLVVFPEVHVFALSYRDVCWFHLNKKGRELYVSEIADRARQNGVLRGLNLAGIVFGKVLLRPHIDFEAAFLDGAVIEGSDLTFGNFRGSFFRLARVIDVQFDRACFENAYLSSTRMTNTFIQLANLKGAKLDNADFEGSYLNYSCLIGAQASRIHLLGACLDGTDLRGADLSYASVGKIRPVQQRAKIRVAKQEEVKLTDFRIGRVLLEKEDDTEETGLYVEKTLILSGKRPTSFAGVKYNLNTDVGKTFLNSIKWILSKFCQCRGRGTRKTVIEPASFKRTNFLGIDTNELDWSNNPQLIRDIRYEQYLHAYKVKHWFNRFVLFPLWGITSYYGQSLLVWLFWAAIIICFFGTAFYLGNATSSILPVVKLNGESSITLTDAIYLSGLVFTSLGLGGFEPGNAAGKWWVLAEVMIGFIMLGSLVSFFANKFVRRD